MSHPRDHNQTTAEIFLEAAERWVDAEAAAKLLEETKTAKLAEMKAAYGDIPDSHAERKVKASRGWQEWIESMCNARKAANRAKVNMKYREMKHFQAQGSDATRRAEMRMG